MTKLFMHAKSEQSLNLNGSGFYNGKNYRTMRYASILLWRAECAIVFTGDLNYARELVNIIRNRAKSSTPVMGLCTSTKNLEKDPVVDWTQPANYVIEHSDVEGQYPFNNRQNALLAAQHEKALSFATQNHRFFDLRRWGIITETLNAYIQHDIGFRTFLQRPFFVAGEDEYWPIHQSVIDLQPGISNRNPTISNITL